MSFTKTSEGRVFFKNADNDDAPRANGADSSSKSDTVMPADNTQMQILLLLKSLNSKLKSSQSDQGAFKKQLVSYKATIKDLEDKTSEQETNYIDLEQKFSQKQSEASKKSSRVENSVKDTLKQLEEARKLVQELESKHLQRDEALEELKGQISEQHKKDDKITQRQKALATIQKQQGEKMVSNVAAYVTLTKRVSETETRNESLDNKIEDAKSEYLKLDRKIDKAIEDRNRILRKVDRIEQAVLETRDALNAKAMVLLTDQGVVAGVNIPQISDKMLQTDPTLLNRRLQEEALMPLWRRPVRIQGTSLVLVMIVFLLLGWIISGATTNTSIVDLRSAIAPPPTISLHNAQVSEEQANYVTDNTLQSEYKTYDYETEEPVIYRQDTRLAANNYGITIHEGYDDPAQITDGQELIDISNEDEMLAAFERDPESVAHALNNIEPSSLTTKDKVEPKSTISPQNTKILNTAKSNNSEYITSLKKRITPDPYLTEIAKKIETQAFEGIAEAQHDMGAIYVAGHGQIKKDLGRAVMWFKEAAGNGISNAKYNLGVLYHQGLGVEQSVIRAMALYSEAATLGHPEAQYNLAIANIEGIGVPYNPNQAAYFFEMAANEGVVEAAYNLGLIYENGILGETRSEDALAWYKKAADQGNLEAKAALRQLASSLSIDMSDIDRIIENLPKTNNNYTGGSASSSAQSYVTAQIQKELMNRGLYPGPVDGMTGPMTENAIRQFQSSVNLDINGQSSQGLLSYLKASPYYE